MSRPDFSRAGSGFEKRVSGPTEVGPTRPSFGFYSYLSAFRIAAKSSVIAAGRASTRGDRHDTPAPASPAHIRSSPSHGSGALFQTFHGGIRLLHRGIARGRGRSRGRGGDGRERLATPATHEAEGPGEDQN